MCPPPAPPPPADKDLTFLAEAGITSALDTGRWTTTAGGAGAGAGAGGGGEEERPAAEDLAAAEPVTIYSEAARKGDLQGTRFFGTEHNAAAGAMGHTRDFTKMTWDMTKNNLRYDEDWGNDWPPQLEPRVRRLHQHTTLPREGAVLPGPAGTVIGRTGPGGWAEFGGRTVNR